MMAREGVVTALDMAGPAENVFYNLRNHGSGMNIACLEAFTLGEGAENAGPGDGEIRDRLAAALRDGAFGVKLLGGHYPQTPETTGKVIRHAADMGVYVAFHAGTTSRGSNLEGMREALLLAEGRPLHLAHINSYCRGAVMDPLREVAEAVELLRRSPNVWSESYLNVFNGTSGKCREGRVMSQVTRVCCGKGGFSEDEKGLGEAILAGYCRVTMLRAGENVLVTGREGRDLWRSKDTDVTVSFPVNIPEVQLSLAAVKDGAGDFVVDALCTDGGGIPRNTMVRHGLAMAAMGALTPAELVRKLSVNAARMLGLRNKGSLAPGADGDITVLDPALGRARMGIARGGIIMVDGVAVGSGGSALTSAEGEARLRALGLPYGVVDSGDFLRNKERAS